MKWYRPKLIIHPEGYPIIAASVLTSIGLTLFLRRYFSSSVARWAAILSGIVDLLLLCFFRNPPRPHLLNNALIISPASGTIVDITSEEDPEYIKGQCTRIAIFLSIFNVHVNVVPVNGEVTSVKHWPGRYVVAFHPKASELNERTVTAIRTTTGHMIVVYQIAGITARRISTYVHSGDVIRCGQELGFIKFGSRVELFLPLSCKITARVGDRVKVGETTLATFS